MAKRKNETAAPGRTVRCAVYTRKSTEEGLQQEFNSLDAQREAGEACVASQKAEGWVCLPDRYDDGGFTGGNMDRPAVGRLMRDIEAGKVDCVVVYKVDRLSRSLLDFARMMETFDKHKVSFVSVTQHFNTAHSMGRLTLNILLSFAQFEREIIGERTRDKIAAARRRGKWMGGKPLLGYDLEVRPGASKLVVNKEEAKRVCAIFGLYLEHERLSMVLRELAERDWRNKEWTTRTGRAAGGQAFHKTMLFRLLTNPTYIGKIRHHDEIHPGEHEGIVEPGVWERVQVILKRNGRSGGSKVRNKYGALLSGLLRCVPCNAAMGHSYTTKGVRRYRYYICGRAAKKGWHVCPTKGVPAAEIEKFVVDQIRRIAVDRGVIDSTLNETQRRREQQLVDLKADLAACNRNVTKKTTELRKAQEANGHGDAGHYARAREELGALERRATVLRDQIHVMETAAIDEGVVREALASFDPTWDALRPDERARLVHLLVERIDFDRERGTVAVTFRPNGIEAIAKREGNGR